MILSSELNFINNILFKDLKKIYQIKFMIPIDNDNYYTLFEIDCENFNLNEYSNNINEKIQYFNKHNPIPLQNIDYKMVILIKNDNEFIWKECIV